MTDNPHPDLAGLVAAPLEPHERLTAAAARLMNAAKTPGPVAYPIRHALGALAATMEQVAPAHGADPDLYCASERKTGEPCVVLLMADALLGEELSR